MCENDIRQSASWSMFRFPLLDSSTTFPSFFSSISYTFNVTSKNLPWRTKKHPRTHPKSRCLQAEVRDSRFEIRIPDSAVDRSITTSNLMCLVLWWGKFRSFNPYLQYRLCSCALTTIHSSPNDECCQPHYSRHTAVHDTGVAEMRFITIIQDFKSNKKK